MSDPTNPDSRPSGRKSRQIQVDELVLNTETVRDLTDEQSSLVQGGLNETGTVADCDETLVKEKCMVASGVTTIGGVMHCLVNKG